MQTKWHNFGIENRQTIQTVNPGRIPHVYSANRFSVSIHRIARQPRDLIVSQSITERPRGAVTPWAFTYYYTYSLTYSYHLVSLFSYNSPTQPFVLLLASREKREMYAKCALR